MISLEETIDRVLARFYEPRSPGVDWDRGDVSSDVADAVRRWVGQAMEHPR